MSRPRHRTQRQHNDEVKSVPGPPMTLGIAATAKLRLVVWYKTCGYRSEPDPAEQARWYGPETSVPEWRRRLVCSQCGSRNVDMVVDRDEAVRLRSKPDAGGIG
jgi:hypothetical protein